MHILVAIADFDHSKTTLRQCAQLAHKQPCSITLLTVVKSTDEETMTNTKLREAMRFCQNDAMKPQNVRTKTRLGVVEEQIAEEALSGVYDLLLIGEKGQHNILSKLLGPMAIRIISQPPCPVLIAKEQAHPLQQVLVCDSVFANPNVPQRFARQFPQLLAQAENVTILHVMSQIAAAPGIDGSQLRADANELISVHSPEGDVLNHDVQLLNHINQDTEPIVRHGLVVDEILAEASDGNYDLIVIGAHPQEGWQRFLLEDVTSQIVLQADRPVLVIP